MRREITAGKLSKILKEHKRRYENADVGEKADLSGADLRNANLYGADLIAADLSGADLEDANLSYADLTQVYNFCIKQLSEARTLYKAKLDPELKKQVKDEYPHLLEESKSEE